MEQRRTERYIVSAEADIQFLPNFGFMAARTRDISADSVFIETGINDPVQDSIVQIKIWLQDSILFKSEKLMGIIVRKSDDGFALRFGRTETARKFLASVVPDSLSGRDK